MRLQAEFYRRKVTRLQARLGQAGLDGMLLLQPLNIYYLVGFFYAPAERPVALFVPSQGEPALFVPKLEEDHAAGHWLDRVSVYFEYPGETSPWELLGREMAAWGFAHADLGFEGSISWSVQARLARLLPQVRWQESGALINEMRLLKEPEELELIAKAATFADYMVAAGFDLLESGRAYSELELNNAVQNAVVAKMVAELPEVVYVRGIAGGRVTAGERAAFPHGLVSSRIIRGGDMAILSFGCSVGGYNAESERTVFMGPPSSEQERYYLLMHQAQEQGTNALVPGSTCAAANRVCLGILEQAGMQPYLRHRMGHGIGINFHEPPWVEDGDDTVLAAGMVLSSEPGLYIPGHGGYRISDTVAVTAAGPERLTGFPRDLPALIVRGSR